MTQDDDEEGPTAQLECRTSAVDMIASDDDVDDKDEDWDNILGSQVMSYALSMLVSVGYVLRVEDLHLCFLILLLGVCRKLLPLRKNKKRKQRKSISRCFARRMGKQCLDFQSFLEYENLTGLLVIVKGGTSEVPSEVRLVF